MKFKINVKGRILLTILFLIIVSLPVYADNLTNSSTNVLNYFNITTSNYTVSNPANSSNSSSTNSTNSSKITVDKLDILNNATEATINVWVKQNKYRENGGLAGKYEANPFSRSFLVRTVLNNSLSVVLSSNGNQGITHTSTTTLKCGITNNNKWTMISVSFDGNKVIYYKNGRKCDEDTTSVKMLYAASIPLTLGYGNNVELNGEVDDYKVYRKALKIEQIRRLYEENSKGGDQGNSLTILTYHQILENGSNASDHVNKVNFTEQIEYLNKSGFKGLTVAEYDQIRKTNSSIPKKSIIITFDDGWKSIYEKAFPILDNYSYVATNFIVTNYANGSSGYISYMNWSEVEDLKDKGWDVQSHSVSHKNLINLSEEEYRKQLNDSKTILKDKLNVDANSFAFPFSSSNQSYTEICGEYYDLCWTKATKASSPSYVYKNTLNVFSSLKRINIGFDTTLNWFKSMLGRDTDIEVEGNKTGYT